VTDGDSSQDSEVASDFRNDKIIAAMRIEQSDLTVGKLVAQGGYGVVYSGFYRGRHVAIKQMLSNAWRDDKKLVGFIDEIRLCANLDYPKIVEFIGVAWSSLRDLSAVIEFMNGGDLHSLIHKYPESSGTEWSQPWTPMGLQNKSLMAMDVAEAVVYLHSFNSIIIHRDLKAKNVLLDELGNAKLSDFGISREVPIDETMTSEIGTVAWIAPEVLRGGRYSEKADIYSLGVLLVELDRCCHPYAHLDESAMGSARHGTDSLGHKHMQIALLVSTGQLRPSVSRQCPSLIASLVDRCLQYDPAERPSAMEVFYALRQSRKYSL
jgi:serine/threonine protein kinase